MAAELEFRRANDPLRLRPLFQSPQQEAEDDTAENSKAATLPRLVDPAHVRKPGTAAERLSQRSIATSCLYHDVQSIWASVWRQALTFAGVKAETKACPTAECGKV